MTVPADADAAGVTGRSATPPFLAVSMITAAFCGSAIAACGGAGCTDLSKSAEAGLVYPGARSIDNLHFRPFVGASSTAVFGYTYEVHSPPAPVESWIESHLASLGWTNKSRDSDASSAGGVWTRGAATVTVGVQPASAQNDGDVAVFVTLRDPTGCTT